jgi:hypothetical protein
MQSIEIDPELNRLALAEAAEQYRVCRACLARHRTTAFKRIRLAT